MRSPRILSVLPRRRRLALLTAFTLVTAICQVLTTSPARAADPCAPVLNPVACENSKAGTPPEDWDILGAGDDTIQGYATDISVGLGETIGFKVATDASAYTIDVFRLGFYGGDGARRITPVTPNPGVVNSTEDCLINEDIGIFDCGAWNVSASWTVPVTMVSGVYIAKLTRPDTGGASHIVFVVRNDASTSDMLFQTSDATWQAYNLWGGPDFYEGGENGRAYKVSYNRPFATRGAMEGRDFLFSAEYPMLRFLERNGYDVSYTTNIDSDRRGQLIQNHKVFITNGHDEYWSAAQRANVEAARDAGTHLAFFSGNDVYWRTRYEPSTDGPPTDYRTLVCYKETWAETDTLDPTSEWTGTWRDPRFSPPANGGGRPENELIGTAYMANSTDLPMTVPAAQGRYRLWRGTSVADLTSGLATLAPHTVGYESNEDLDNGFRPPGLIRLSTTVGPTPEYLLDFGKNVAPGTTTHSMTLYRAPSGALVFSAGTIQWAWGLDDYHDGAVSPVDERMQQATINLFADMNVQPATLMSGMAAATPSTDTAAPTVAITTPAATATVANGSQVTLSGTATDTGGGRVAGVEVSLDNGVSWHPAVGTSSWSYTFYTSGLGAQMVQVRAIDDSVNIGDPVARQFVLTGRNTLFGARVPANTSTNDGTSLELGVKFRPSVAGFVTAVRFYKGAGNTGTHTGSLWSSSGERLANGTFTDESASGWQTLKFSRPVEITPSSTYIASYYAPNGHYAADGQAFSLLDWSAPPLRAPRSATVGGNGVFGYGAGFPTRTYGDTNYYVDVQFVSSENAPPAPVATTPLHNASGVDPAVHPAVVFTKSLDPATITFAVTSAAGAPVAGTFAYAAPTKTVTFTPSAPFTPATTYHATVTATDTNGITTEEPVEWTFTTDLNPSVKRLFATDAVPDEASSDDAAPVELGVKFVPLTSGKIIGLRYYQGAGNTGTHTGTLWSSTGDVIRQVTFGPGSGNGWQTAAFDSPVDVLAGGTYVLSYFAPNGGYAATPNYFTTARTNGPLRAPAGANGVYRYGSTGFPTSSYNSTNYWVDPLFLPSTGPGPTPEPPTGVNVFDATATPAQANSGDEDPINVGMKFIPDVDGTVTGMRFWKGPENTGTHTGALWTVDGDPLAQATFGTETASGWQSIRFATPVEVSGGQTYVVGYHTAAGQYAVTPNGFADAGVIAPPLRVPQGGGMYAYGTSNFPNLPINNNFWTDVYFEPSTTAGD
ncbi:DUF4082 domain-containing protein [Actinoplanes rectilineatus]|uniref:DUF4082 domain-containing protein n=1 Tax=Actinoplanes rectilineatus TaxID=113571 RepID=UPI0006966CC4|nr:DUF4082 domain-containing protein [Actinoplanes rectilineatus]